MINTFGAFLGMGIVVVGIIILWHLADKNPQKPKTKHRHRHA